MVVSIDNANVAGLHFTLSNWRHRLRHT